MSDRRAAVVRVLELNGWKRFFLNHAGASDNPLWFFRHGKSQNQQLRVGGQGGLAWLWKDGGGRWRERRPPRGDEEVGIREALDAGGEYDREERARRRRWGI